MDMIYIAALLIGGTTLLGTFCGFLLNNVSPRWNDIVSAFAAGVMLCAAMFGLFQPAMELGKMHLVIFGALSGMIFLRITAKFAPVRMLKSHPELMFVLALAMHKFPEGMAGGVGMASGAAGGMTAALGVALQNFPEGVVMIPPLLKSGVSRKKAACIALLTGLLNAAGVFAGGIWGAAGEYALAFALAFAGGAMLDVIVKDMIPRIFQSKIPLGEWILTGGFLLMTAISMMIAA